MKRLLLAATLLAAPAFAEVPEVPKAAPFQAGAVPFGTADAAAVSGAPRENSVVLARAGYVEEEYTLAGTAGDKPYVTRLLLRRPADAARFSGTIALEPLADPGEPATLWNWTNAHSLANGDAWAGLTIRPSNLAGALKKANGARYAALSLPDGVEATLLAQAAGWLRSAEGPLGKPGLLARAEGLQGQVKLLVLGWGEGACLASRFITSGGHAAATLPTGRPVVNGYLIQACPAAGPLPIPGNAPVIQVLTQSGFGADALKVRQPDGNEPGRNRSRFYELAGVADHAWADLPQFQIAAFQAKAPRLDCPQPASRLPGNAHFLRAMLWSLDRWTRLGVQPPPAKPFETDETGGLKRDENGNVLGGTRPHWVELATTMIAISQGGAGLCSQMARETPLPAERVAQRFQGRETYLEQVAQHLDGLVSSFQLRYLDAKDELDQLRAGSTAPKSSAFRGTTGGQDG